MAQQLLLDERTGTTVHLDDAQLRRVRFYAWLHGVSLAQAVVELLRREQERKREGARASELFQRAK